MSSTNLMEPQNTRNIQKLKMSFMEKLLEGVEVEWKALGEICEVGDGNHSSKYPKSNEMVNHGVPFIRGTNIVNGIISGQNMKYITPEKHKELRKGHLKAYDVLIANRGEIGKIAYIPKHFAGSNLNSQLAWLRSKPAIILPRYLFFVLNTSFIQSGISGEGGALQQLTIRNIKLINIPVPSLEIQTEIVRILDTFTELTTELTTELGARKKQYNYYRDQLLTFEDGEVEWKALGDLTIDKFWIMPATPKFNENESVPYITSKNIRGGHIYFKKVKFISRQDYLNLSRNRPIIAGDFLISMIGTIGEVARVKESDIDFYGQNMYLVRLNDNLINSGYFLHFFDSPKMKSHFNAVKNNSGQGYLKANNINSIRVPVPSLEEQARIVAILDKFDALTHSITEGLPHEIELRQKQYAYYRDLLLNFPKPEEANS